MNNQNPEAALRQAIVERRRAFRDKTGNDPDPRALVREIITAYPDLIRQCETGLCEHALKARARRLLAA